MRKKSFNSNRLQTAYFKDSSRKRFYEYDSLVGKSLHKHDLRGAKFSGSELKATVFDSCIAGLTRRIRKISMATVFLIFVIPSGFSAGYWSAALGSQFVNPLDPESYYHYYALIVMALAISYILFLCITVLKVGIKSETLRYLIPSLTAPLALSAIVMGLSSGAEGAFLLTLTLLCINILLGSATLAISFVIIHAMRSSYVKWVVLFFLLSGFLACIIEIIVSVVHSDKSNNLLYIVPPFSSLVVFLFLLFYSHLFAQFALENRPNHLATKRFCTYWMSRRATKFQGKLCGVSFINSELSNVDFREVDEFRRVDWEGAKLEWAYFEYGEPSSGLLKGVPTHNKNILNLVTVRKGESISGNFEGLNLRSINLTGRNLSGLNFSRTVFDEGDLCRANFERALLTNIRAWNADFTHSNLTEVDLSNSSLGGAQFNNADLTGVKFDHTLISERTAFINVRCKYLRLGNKRFPAERDFEREEFSQRFQRVRSIMLDFLGTIDSSSLTNREPDYGDGYFAIDYLLHLEYNGELTTASMITVMGDYNVNSEVNKVNISGGSFHGSTNIAAKASNISSVVSQDQTQPPSEQELLLQEVADKIQQALDTLQTNNPDVNDETKRLVIDANVPVDMRRRALSAVEELGKAALEELLDNSYVNIALRAIDGWRNAD